MIQHSIAKLSVTCQYGKNRQKDEQETLKDGQETSEFPIDHKSARQVLKTLKLYLKKYPLTQSRSLLSLKQVFLLERARFSKKRKEWEGGNFVPRSLFTYWVRD